MQEAICEGHQQKDHHGGKHLRLWHSTSSWKALLEETCTSYRLPRPVRAAVSHILVRKDKWGSPIPKQPEEPHPQDHIGCKCYKTKCSRPPWMW